MAEILTNTLSLDFDKQLELIYKPIFNQSYLERFFTVKEDVQSKYELPIVGRMARGLKSWDRGCGLPEAPAGTSITPRDLEVCAVQSYYEHCPNDWFETVYRKWQKTGADTNNIVGTPFEDIIAKLVGEQTLEDVWRIIFFGDTTSEDTDFSACDGFWKIIMDDIASYAIPASQRYAVTSETLGDCDSQTILDGLIAAQSIYMKKLPKAQKFILVTGSIFDNLELCLENACCGDASWNALQNGFGDNTPYETLMYRGYTVVAMREWDTYIDDLGGTFPHRAAMWTPSNNWIGTNAWSDKAQVKIWYSDDDDINKVLVRMLLGYQYVLADYIAVAY